MFKFIGGQFRQYFIAGLLTLIPLTTTVWIFKTILYWTENFFFGLFPQSWQPSSWSGLSVPGIGILITLSFILLCGMIARTYIASRLLALGETLLAQVPIARGIYPGIKRIAQLMLGDPTTNDRRVVIIPYPHPSSRAYAFVTGEINLEIDSQQVKHLRVFVPTTPNPTSGFMLMIPEQDIIYTSMTIDQASKIIISGGLA